jgi:histidine triad (HIT) family protein
MSDCIFCQILSGKLSASIVYQGDRCTALMDIQPVNPGHVLVIPNNHEAYLADLDEQIGADLFRVTQRIAVALRHSGIKCEGVNLFLADGEAAGQEVFHVHMHVFPRYGGDGFGLKFGPRYGIKPERIELNAMAERIRKAF